MQRRSEYAGITSNLNGISKDRHDFATEDNRQVALPPFRVAKTLEVQGAVYALSAFEGRLLGAVTSQFAGQGDGDDEFFWWFMRLMTVNSVL